MIQRIQSIYMTLGALSILALLFFDGLWNSQAVRDLAWFAPALVILGALIVILTMRALFSYKDRKRQRKLVVAIQMLTLAFTAMLFIGLFISRELILLGSETAIGGILFIVLLPVLAYTFFFLARRGIDRDISLVRSMDRLR